MPIKTEGTTYKLNMICDLTTNVEFIDKTVTKDPPCSFGLISRINSHPAVFFSHNKPANSAFSTINQRNEQAERALTYSILICSVRGL
jgi:hypothetical protein